MIVNYQIIKTRWKRKKFELLKNLKENHKIFHNIYNNVDPAGLK